MAYPLIVIVAAANGGCGAGLFAALAAALSYDYFLTTPYHTLVIDTAGQVVTVGLLFAAGWSPACRPRPAACCGPLPRAGRCAAAAQRDRAGACHWSRR